MKPLVFDHRASEEFDAAVDWYEERRVGLGDAFIDAVDRVANQIVEAPALASKCPGVDPSLNVRRVVLRRFPYAVVYLELEDQLLVLAVAHGHRKPGYWRERLPR
jgi:plasmid stabilization system protein ParE